MSVATRNNIDYGKLKGRTILVFMDGWYYRRVVRVIAGKRIGLRALRVAAPQYEGMKGGKNRWSWNGPKRTIRMKDRETLVKGVLYRKEIIPIEEFCR